MSDDTPACDWHVYIVECGDGSLYTGIAKDVAQRVADHAAGKGAKYTRGRGPIELLESKGPMTRSDALKLEHTIKATPREAKVEALGQSG